jgi:hypothetical protein
MVKEVEPLDFGKRAAISRPEGIRRLVELGLKMKSGQTKSMGNVTVSSMQRRAPSTAA